MKAILLRKALGMALAALLTGTTALAQNNWFAHHTDRQPAPAVAPKTMPTGEVLLVSYSTGYNSTIWQGDGFSFNSDMRIGAAALFTKDMVAPYAGGKIVGLRLGWNDPESSATYEAFITKGINGEEIATCGGEIGPYSYGGNGGYENFFTEEDYVIPEGGEDIFAGYYVDVKAGVVCVPTLYPRNVPNSCYLWSDQSGDESYLPDGSKNWLDFSKDSDCGPLAIQLIIEDTNGSLANLVSINSAMADEITTSGAFGSAVINMSNRGTADIKSLEITTWYGEQTNSMSINLSKALASGDSKNISIPVYCFGTGEHTYYISKINGEENAHVQELSATLLGIPENVAKEYTFRPLLEWCVSENSYMTPRYTDEYFMPVYNKFADQMTLVCQHLDDQFMTGDDDATTLLLDLANKDSTQVSLPSTLINRSFYSFHPIPSLSTPATSGVLLDPVSSQFYERVLTCPTFASVEADAALDGDKVKINVSGNIAEGVMPEDEPLYLTVYLMEKDVESDSQIFWTEKEEEEQTGNYTHPNIIRQLVTPFYGQKLGSNSGNYAESLETEIDPSWNKANLSVVAFLNRGIENGNFSAQVINSTETPVSAAQTSIQGVENGNGISIENQNGSFQSSRGTVEVYTTDGRRVPNSQLNAGVYLVKVMAGGQSTVRKMIVK